MANRMDFSSIDSVIMCWGFLCFCVCVCMKGELSPNLTSHETLSGDYRSLSAYGGARVFRTRLT
jgi:hypothetical protein